MRNQDTKVLVELNDAGSANTDSKANKSKILPKRLSYSDSARREKLDYLQNTQNCDLGFFSEMRLDPESLRGNIESLIGAVEIPLGVAGPLRINGSASEREIYAPLATSEGALVSSINRGCRALMKSGGVTTRFIKQRMVRAPLFDCGSVSACMELKNWISRNTAEIQKKVRESSNHAQLVQIECRVLPPCLHVRFVFETGDASGQNMTTVATWNACRWILDSLNRDSLHLVRHFVIDGNQSTDKKASTLAAISGRGCEVVAEALVPDRVIRHVLRSTVKDMIRVLSQGQMGQLYTGQQSYNINIANSIAAIYAATGQDLACIHESSNGQLYFEEREEGLYVSLALPNLVIGTVGGGTGLPGSRALLELMDCCGPHQVQKFAENIAAFSLALELSTGAALAGGHFVSAHENLGRNKHNDWLTKKDLTPSFFNHLIMGRPEWGPVVKVVENQETDRSHSLVMDLASQTSQRVSGLWSYDIHFANKIKPQKTFLKVKVPDTDLMLAFEIMAGLLSPGLSEVMRENREISPFNKYHERELRISEMTHPSMQKIMPKTLGTLYNEKRDIFILAQEYLEDVEHLGLSSSRSPWSLAHIQAAIAAITEVHVELAGDIKVLLGKSWLFRYSENQIQQLAGPYLELARQLCSQSLGWFEPEDVNFHRKMLLLYPQLWRQAQALPQTLIHHDFNPRNIVFKKGETGSPAPIVYDWELATVGLPQRDIVELLSFTCRHYDEVDILDLLKNYRSSLEESLKFKYSDSDWKLALETSLLDFILIRLPMYSIAQSFRRVDFLEPSYKNARRLHQIIRESL